MVAKRLTGSRARARIWAAAVLVSCTVGGCAQAGSHTKTAPTSEGVLGLLLRDLPGDYRSQNVVAQNRLTTHIRRVDLPWLGEHVLYLEEYRGAGSGDLERIRLYRFSDDPAKGRVRLRLWNPLDPEALRGGYLDLARIEALVAADLRPDRAECELNFRQTPAGNVAGRMNYRRCTLPGEWVDYELYADSRGHWVCYSRRSLADDHVVWQLVSGRPCVFMARQE